MRELEYPFQAEYILKKKKSIKRELLGDGSKRIKKKIAILGGSTTSDIRLMLELFLLDAGIEPEFYESEYAQYWQDVMFDNPELSEFSPDLIYIHTTARNINRFPTVRDSEERIADLVKETVAPFETMWTKIEETYHCPIIQNNFQQPSYRLLGNKDVSDPHGKLNFVNRLNEAFYEYAGAHANFFINDINYMASCYGLERWSDPFYWHMYKYEPAVPAIPELAYNLANIIKSIYGKNKKAFVLDLDNTLWGG
ncbi:MAG: HAD family hydrolase, partial [Lachnospiraceae bacterium]|nr:HAD family hydrolase [Lachnospiraceae bacterium]